MAEPLKPLMLAIEDVLAAIGDPEKLEERLRHTVRQLSAEHKRFMVCCCHDGIVSGKKSSQSQS